MHDKIKELETRNALLRAEYDRERAAKEQLIEEFKPYDEGERHLHELRCIPFFLGEDDHLVISLVRDDLTCSVARQQALAEVALQNINREAKLPVQRRTIMCAEVEMRPRSDRVARSHSLHC